MPRHVQAAKTTFQLVLIKPTHYDDDGYPITWLQSHIPSNTLAALYGLGEDCRRRQVLGPDIDIVIKPLDETNIRIRPDRIVADIRRSGGKALICLVGVQSNQFPRAVDLARQFLKAGLPVALGGFHVSGCLSMLPVIPAEIQQAMDMGVSIFGGEAEEGRLGLSGTKPCKDATCPDKINRLKPCDVINSIQTSSRPLPKPVAESCKKEPNIRRPPH